MLFFFFKQKTAYEMRISDWSSDVCSSDLGPVLDKHSVGGLPGNRTTPIVVAIVAALGYRIPKTSSRAITSPAGTADTMEVMAPVSQIGRASCRERVCQYV